MNKNKAFSLLEVLMAMAILSIAVLPIMSMYPNALKMSTRATELEEWSRTTETIVDYVKSRGYTYINSNFSSINGDYTDITGNINTGYTSDSFASRLLAGKKSLFLLNTKGMNLENYKFQVQIKKNIPAGIGTEKLDFSDHTYHSGGGKGQDFYYGVVRIREKNGDFNIEDKRDMSFMVTPIENWK